MDGGTCWRKRFAGGSCFTAESAEIAERKNGLNTITYAVRARHPVSEVFQCVDLNGYTSYRRKTRKEVFIAFLAVNDRLMTSPDPVKSVQPLEETK
jgi:hypothetical protein